MGSEEKSVEFCEYDEHYMSSDVGGAELDVSRLWMDGVWINRKEPIK